MAGPYKVAQQFAPRIPPKVVPTLLNDNDRYRLGVATMKSPGSLDTQATVTKLFHTQPRRNNWLAGLCRAFPKIGGRKRPHQRRWLCRVRPSRSWSQAGPLQSRGERSTRVDSLSHRSATSPIFRHSLANRRRKRAYRGDSARPTGTGESSHVESMPRHFDFRSVGEEFGADVWANDALGEHIEICRHRGSCDGVPFGAAAR